MKQVLLLAAGMALAQGAFAQELVTIQTRPGVQQSFFIANMGQRKPDAAALLLVGGGGTINLRHEDGGIKFRGGNFLPRSRGEFIRNGILPLIVHAPSDQQAQGMSDAFRRSAEHAADMRGGKRAESGRCDPLSAHGFFGKEPETVAAIAGWMLAKPFAREIQ